MGEEVSLVLTFHQAGEIELRIPVPESQMGHQKPEMKPDHQHLQKSKTN